jgi:hypothetical protein
MVGLWYRLMDQAVGSADVVVVQLSANDCAYAMSLVGWICVGQYDHSLGLPRERDANKWGWHTALMALPGPVAVPASTKAPAPPCDMQIPGVLRIVHRPARVAIGPRTIAVPHRLVAVALGGYPVTRTLVRVCRRVRRRRQGLCVLCGYDLRGNESPQCPARHCSATSGPRGGKGGDGIRTHEKRICNPLP